MSNIKDSIQPLRENLGYVNSGNTNMKMFGFNWLLVILASIVVGLIWGIRNSDSIDKTDSEKKDLLIMGIIAATIFFLVVFPINIGRAFSGNIPRHPIYMTYAIISAIFTAYLGIYYGTVAKGGDQGSYILGASIITAIITVVSFYLYFATTNPYSFYGLNTLSENDYYNINNEAYTEYLLIKKIRKTTNKTLEYNDAKKAYYLVFGKELKEKEYQGKKDTITNRLRAEVSIAGKDYEKNFFKLGIIKQYYNEILKEKANDPEGKNLTKKFDAFKEKLRDTNFTIQYSEFQKIKSELNQKIYNKPLDISDYNKYFGYYDPYTGAGTAAISAQKFIDIEKEKGITDIKIQNLKKSVQIYNQSIKRKVKKPDGAPYAPQERQAEINKYIEEQSNEGKEITNINDAVDIVFNK